MNLRDRIRELSVDTGVVDAHTLTAKLLPQLTPAEVRDALGVILPDYIRGVLGIPWAPPEVAPPAAGPGPSRARAVREAWRAELHKTVTTPGGAKHVADCTVEDVLFLAADRRSQAADLVARAEQFDRLHAEMVKARKKRVGDLPVKVLAAVYGDGSQ